MFQCFYQRLDALFTEIKFQLGFILLACQVQSLAADLKKFQDWNFPEKVLNEIRDFLEQRD